MEDPTLNFEVYAATLQQVMQNAIAQAETLQKEAEAEREVAFADQDKNQDLLHELDNDARRKAEDDALRNYPNLKKEIIATLLNKLEKAGKTASEIAVLKEALGVK